MNSYFPHQVFRISFFIFFGCISSSWSESSTRGDNYLTALFESEISHGNTMLEDLSTVKKEELVNTILNRAQFVFSGMLYGYQFNYTPQDTRREVSEAYSIKLIKEISRGNKSLSVIETFQTDNQVYVRLGYRLNKSDISHREAWNSNSIPVSSGTGTGNRFLNENGRRQALESAMIVAIRNHLRARISKPRLIKGEVFIWKTPMTVVSANEFHTTVTIKILIDKIVPYLVF